MEKKIRVCVDGKDYWFSSMEEADSFYYDPERSKCERFITVYDENGEPAYGAVSDTTVFE